MIDETRVIELKEEIGEDDFADVLAIFLEEIDEALGNLDPSGPSDQLASDLHALKGSAQNIGFAGFAEICRTAEVDGAPSDLQARLRAAFTSSKAAISADYQREA